MKALSLLSALAIFSGVQAGVPLEPENGKIYFGAWYARPNGDTPAAINTRVGKKLAMFQSDFNITDTINEGNPLQFLQQMDETKSDAIMYLTAYPMYGFDSVTDKAIDDLANLVANVTNSGRRVFLRYASEMNGNWFAYGRQPRKFIDSFRKVVTAVRSKSKPETVAIVWAPNSSNGYPFANDPAKYPYPAPLINSSHPDWDILDTNGDGQLTVQDDPYSPYYPGDDYVDWVGMSQYHYGSVFSDKYDAWVDNSLPNGDQIHQMIRGGNNKTLYDFYGMFCEGGKTNASQGGKPFQLTETGSTFHIRLRNETEYADPGPGRVAIKKAWWEQFLNEAFITQFPHFKAFNFFEFQKYEESSLRDFTNLGPNPSTLDPFTGAQIVNETNAVLDAFLADLPNFEMHLIWGNDSDIDSKKPKQNETAGGNGTGQPNSPSGSVNLSGAEGSRVGLAAILGAVAVGLVGLVVV
ncbi:hypothetical protein HK097_002472 [Rhizophlyctis rosea]|uniref:GH26 domain-containing protein n=1 Tax=Rhizophlyctis rosea TaxID=64517 RepID=A0AAD5S5J2_9FUNG|nr:hypothetical protein HK097_002472 [Rhizophlyctis rosea]